MKKVLVAVDLSGATVQVCNAARDLAQPLGARLIILHVVPPPPLMLEYYALSTVQVGLLERGARRRAAEKLQALAHWFGKSCPDTKVVEHAGPPVERILRTAKRVKPDYIVLGSHGHSAAFELLAGSVAHGVLMASPVPVVLVPIRPRVPATRAKPSPAEAQLLVSLR